MASNLATPGVYVEEKSSFGTSVVPVPTAVPAFVGYTQKALRGTKSLTNKPTRITNFGEFINNDSLSMGHCKTTCIGNRLSMSPDGSSFTNNSYLFMNGDKGLDIRSDFTNSQTGEMIIRCNDDDCLESFTPAVFICEGTMDIDTMEDSEGGSN